MYNIYIQYLKEEKKNNKKNSLIKKLIHKKAL